MCTKVESSAPLKYDNHPTEKQSNSVLNKILNDEPCQPVPKQAIVFARVTQHSLICPLCHERFHSPVRKLDCTHSFCETCLEKFIDKQRTVDIVCPTCMEETTLPPGGIRKLRSDFNLNSQLDDVDIHDFMTKVSADIDDDIPDLDYVSTLRTEYYEFPGSHSAQLKSVQIEKTHSFYPARIAAQGMILLQFLLLSYTVAVYECVFHLYNFFLLLLLLSTFH